MTTAKTLAQKDNFLNFGMTEKSQNPDFLCNGLVMNRYEWKYSRVIALIQNKWLQM